MLLLKDQQWRCALLYYANKILHICNKCLEYTPFKLLCKIASGQHQHKKNITVQSRGVTV